MIFFSSQKSLFIKKSWNKRTIICVRPWLLMPFQRFYGTIWIINVRLVEVVKYFDPLIRCLRFEYWEWKKSLSRDLKPHLRLKFMGWAGLVKFLIAWWTTGFLPKQMGQFESKIVMHMYCLFWWSWLFVFKDFKSTKKRIVQLENLFWTRKKG